MTFKRVLVICLFLGMILLLACGGTAKITMAKRLITNTDNIPFTRLTKLVVTESQDSKRLRTRLRIVPNNPVDLFVRAMDDSGNIYVLPPKFKATWSVVSFSAMKQAVIEPMNESMYPVETIDAASSRAAKAHVIRFTVLDQHMPSPVVVETSIVFRTRAGGEMILNGGIQLEMVQSDVELRESERSTFF